MICRKLCQRHAFKTRRSAGKQGFQVVVELFNVTVGLETWAAAGHQLRGVQHEFNMVPTLPDRQVEEMTHTGAITPVGAEPMRDGQEPVGEARPETRVK